jgi:hypothetical protein
MSAMGAYVLELQTKQDEENAHVPAYQESSSRHRNEPRVVAHMGGRGGIREWRPRTRQQHQTNYTKHCRGLMR